MQILFQHPRLNNNKWTRVIRGAGGVLITANSYEVLSGIHLSEGRVFGNGLNAQGGQWLSDGETLYRSAGIFTNQRGTEPYMFLINVDTGGRRRVGAQSIGQLTIVEPEPDDFDIVDIASVESHFQSRQRSAETYLRSGEECVATLQATEAIRQVYNRRMEAAPVRPAVATPVPAPQEAEVAPEDNDPFNNFGPDSVTPPTESLRTTVTLNELYRTGQSAPVTRPRSQRHNALRNPEAPYRIWRTYDRGRG